MFYSHLQADMVTGVESLDTAQYHGTSWAQDLILLCLNQSHLSSKATSLQASLTQIGHPFQVDIA